VKEKIGCNAPGTNWGRRRGVDQKDQLPGVLDMIGFSEETESAGTGSPLPIDHQINDMFKGCNKTMLTAVLP
jgi:hypothetical protein